VTPSRWRLALGLSPTPRPGLVLLLFGMALGPLGLGILSRHVLASLDPIVSVGLATLGVLIGLDLGFHPRREGRLLLAATLEAGITTIVVGAGFLIIHAWSRTTEATPWLFALMLGICASPSSTSADAFMEPGSSRAARAGDLDDVLPIVVGLLALAWQREGSIAAGAWLAAQAAAIAIAIAAATWLLVTGTTAEGEPRVFAVGGLLLLGGAAAHLSLSALFAGLVAGAFWRAMAPSALEGITGDIRYVQHPLVVLLLVVAGARLDFSRDLVWLVVAYVVLRLAGKVVGGWLAGRVAARDLPRDLGFHLASPGVVGIAFALNVLQASSRADTATTVFAIVLAGSMGSELLSLVALRRRARA